jgi:hypothetical protein
VLTKFYRDLTNQSSSSFVVPTKDERRQGANTMSNDKIHLPADPLRDCPTCGLPAEITDRFTLGGAPEPVAHVKLVCVMRHWFTIPVDMFVGGKPARSGPAEADAGRDLGERARG